MNKIPGFDSFIIIYGNRIAYFNTLGSDFKNWNFPFFFPIIYIHDKDNLNETEISILKNLLIEFYLLIFLINTNFLFNIFLLFKGNNFFFILILYLLLSIISILNLGETWLKKYSNRKISFSFISNWLIYIFIFFF